MERLSFMKVYIEKCLYFQDGKQHCCLLVCALLLYAKLVTVPEDALQIFAVKRSPINIPPSQLRYLYYLNNIIR